MSTRSARSSAIVHQDRNVTRRPTSVEKLTNVNNRVFAKMANASIPTMDIIASVIKALFQVKIANIASVKNHSRSPH